MNLTEVHGFKILFHLHGNLNKLSLKYHNWISSRIEYVKNVINIKKI